jgi:tetratricopeptide (TPR) repeat protein
MRSLSQLNILSLFKLIALSTTSVLFVLLPIVSAPTNLSSHSAQAQTIDEKKAEAEQLLQEARESFPYNADAYDPEKYKRALFIYQELGDKSKQAETLVLIGLLYANGYNKYNQAFDLFEQAINIYKDINQPIEQAKIYEIKGLILRQIASSQQFDYVFNKVSFLGLIELSKSKITFIDDSQFTADRIDYKITDSNQLYQESLNNFEIAYSLVESSNEIDTMKLKRRLLKSLGEINIFLENNEQAIEHLTLASNLLDKNKNYEENETIYRLLGDAYRNEEKYELALNFYLKALEFRKQNKSIDEEIAPYFPNSQMLERIAETYVLLEKYQEALTFIEEYSKGFVYIISHILNDNFEEIDTYTSENTFLLQIMAQAYEGLGNKEKALQILGLVPYGIGMDGRGAGGIEDSTIIESIIGEALESEYDTKQYENNLLAKADSFIYRADIYQELGKNDKAKEFYQYALEIFTKLKDENKVSEIQQKFNQL